MSEAILLTLWVCTSLFFICREIKANSNRESHESWISELRDCLHSIENEFSRRCFEITKKPNQKCSVYLSQISELKDEYLNTVHDKVTAKRGSYFLKSFPEHIIKEYERNISEIADIYRNVITMNK